MKRTLKSASTSRFQRGMERFLLPLFGTAGALHFLTPKPFDQIVPPELPGSRRTYTYVSGAAELAAAALLSNDRTRRAGGLFSALLLLAVWPGNFYMSYLWRNKPLPYFLGSLARLPLQVPLVTAAWRIFKSND
ncbi:hypothetical protein [Corynebacterium aquatimens]|uniref:Membrane protein n=1 Tax=Corynebacterium aquatimens TaxID=1190508 RepID=A0A931E379_9CORY|nr:hypothetical protein [Corynebacterium aquatimens]MBG6122976.1 putative membrane protein [Corynebacterium aquatimens]WJY66689.1 hypothetical protein CAQUA_10010 [Corynebacterium aquatimens]